MTKSQIRLLNRCRKIPLVFLEYSNYTFTFGGFAENFIKNGIQIFGYYGGTPEAIAQFKVKNNGIIFIGDDLELWQQIRIVNPKRLLLNYQR